MIALALTVLAALSGCGDDARVDTNPNGVNGSEKDSGRPVRSDASSQPALPNLDARVVVPIDDDPRVSDGAVAAQSDASAPDGEASEPGGRTICGGIAGLPCKDDEFCSQEVGSSGLGCGFPDSTGVCTPRGRICADVYTPVCGCDLETYGNECEAHAAGVSVAKRGACPKTEAAQCDERQVTCKRARPLCLEGQVPAVVGSCWGECVAIEQCLCKEAGACPEVDKYACHMSAGHCGPYVN